MANGMMNSPMGAQQPPMEQPMQISQEDAVLNMHLTEDVKKALQSKGVDVSAVQDRGPKEPVIVIPVSVIVNRYQAATPEESMKQFVQDMTANAQPPAAPQPVSAPSPMAAEAPNQEGLGAPMNRPPMTA